MLDTGQGGRPRRPRWLTEDGWVEPAMAVVLSIATLATSWAGYQAALWNSEQTLRYGMANARRVEGARAALDASTDRNVEIGLFNAWLVATDEGDQRRAEFYRSRMPVRFRPAFEQWLAQGRSASPERAGTPFALPVYRQRQFGRAAELDTLAERSFRQGQQANRTSDAYTRATVVLATAMFFAGIGQAFRKLRVRLVLAALAILSCVVGVWSMASLPTIFLAPGG
jgi:hypothetical protein